MHIILKLHYWALGNFPQKIALHRVENVIFIEGQGLALSWVSKYKADVTFIIFRDFDIILEIVDS